MAVPLLEGVFCRLCILCTRNEIASSRVPRFAGALRRATNRVVFVAMRATSNPCDVYAFALRANPALTDLSWNPVRCRARMAVAAPLLIQAADTNMKVARIGVRRMPMRRFFRMSAAVLSLVAALALLAGEANARAGAGSSFGSRGARTFSMPPSTRTAPSAAPIQRSITQAPSRTNGMPAGGLFGRPGGWFGGGLFGRLAAGFLGAGLFGMLFGHGFW